jgi:ketosteroid isomerase-like protein
VEHDKKHKGHSSSTVGIGNDSQPAESPATSEHLEEFFRSLKPEMRRPKPNADAVAAAVEAAHRLAAEAEAEEAAEGAAQHHANASVDDTFDSSPGVAMVCDVCGYHNRGANKFCGMCGVAMKAGAPRAKANVRSDANAATATSPAKNLHSHEAEPEMRTAKPSMEVPHDAPREIQRPSPEFHQERHANGHPETHHYHHHYHHHYFQGGHEGAGISGSAPAITAPGLPRSSDPARDVDRFRPTAALRGDMSRAEAAVRRIAHEWVLACNTKHLDDLLDLYVADAMVLRSNFPPVRGAAAVREFFFAALDAGLGEVELEPLRVDIAGELAYEAGRCKALVPSATGKRREERGKYLWVFARQPGGEWKLTTDCWSSDLTLTTLESDVPQGASVKSTQLRKS